ncbi:hepatitis A virus cellular receptor 1 homolog [Mesocricetus auratus]|uniref:Hepatitis A virus cellular receptor 1 homolog n=1 Tax=Mesocricetus auratus TaxID=10036 RepID=A0ABM2XQK5_MESAU|nr:hepatitis A virus cellular receptor 1 homolog [Mesocricetus auratus]
MTHPQVFISGLILLLPAAIESFPEVHGVVGHPVTLPCTYPVSHGISPMCWGRGACFSDKCNNVVILTNGYYVYYERSNRYHLTGKILQGNVSLTIEKVTERDSGLYCCQLEMKRWNGVQRLTISLRVQPGNDPTLNPKTIMKKGFYIGISITLMLLLLVSIMVTTTMVEKMICQLSVLTLTVKMMSSLSTHCRIFPQT